MMGGFFKNNKYTSSDDMKNIKIKKISYELDDDGNGTYTIFDDKENEFTLPCNRIYVME